MALKLREDRRDVNLRNGWEADYRKKHQTEERN